MTKKFVMRTIYSHSLMTNQFFLSSESLKSMLQLIWRPYLGLEEMSEIRVVVFRCENKK
jgi:hypothetical protein